jgi:hypothetical protein
MEISEQHPLRRLFRGIVENVFYGDLGICDPDLTHYLSDMLVRFVHVDRIWASRQKPERRFEDVVEIISACELEPDGKFRENRLKTHRHIGDYTLFWAGVYPEGLRQIRSHRPSGLIDIVEQGKRSYSIASELSTPQTQPPSALLKRLSDQFEFCIHALTQVRRGWEGESRVSSPKII